MTESTAVRATDVSAELHDVLAQALAAKRQQCELIDPAVGAAAALLSEFVLRGGKRLRPTFAWWGWRGAGGCDEDAPAVLRAVASLELLHAAALLHDDVLDDSRTRRGQPTMHLRLAGAHRRAGWLGDPERFGVAGAVLLGDLALAWADDQLRDAGLAPAALRRTGPIWTAVRTEVLAGQYLDVRAQAAGDESEESALRVALYKSAAYTVARPLQLGAAMAGAQPALMAAYHEFGRDLGVAFQLRDDLLGVFGDPEVTGKPAGDDLREGKRTLLVALALQAAARQGADAAGAVIRGALGRPALSARQLATARTALVELGAVHAVEQRIKAMADSALAVLAAADVDPSAAHRLADLAVQATRRVH